MNYDFGSIIPTDALYDIASSSQGWITSLASSGPIVLLCGILLSFVVVDIIIDTVARRKHQNEYFN